MGAIKALDFVVKRDDLQQSKTLEKNYPDQLDDNKVLFKIDLFSFTSNNITYAVSGDRLGYWKFFPTKDGYGIIPAWGFAEVIRSTHPEVSIGQRFYGYFPMSSHLLVSPAKVGVNGFMDGMPHRKELPSVYNYYSNIEADSTITPKTEKLFSIFRPLFVTSFLIDDFLTEQDFFQTTKIILTSASSKTAQALACLLNDRKKKEGLNLKIIGLTSKANSGFVSGLGWYDQTICYDEIDQLNSNHKHIVVDFTGNHETQFRLQSVLGEHLVYNCLVGLVDWKNMKGKHKLPKKGEFFFAPAHAEKRQKEWGMAKLSQNLGMAWKLFEDAVISTLEIKDYKGAQNLKQVYSDMLNGKIDPKQGNILSLS
ncbi:DUF2855 family protein [Algoriphagus sediminis]|uniref:DUF2855 family protein n=1 Tax=Algoriphagus sediminis TaxID=3057113 RepID=A0ABT7Y8Z4_9BACT|nr:DUF2855 family protein [Algoriphagus sediminis]MDN3202981.1 DUF2855 family protein [Algoriphagus sediminis]